MMSSYGVVLGFELHWIFMIATALGLVALVIYLFKYADKKSLTSLIWIALLVGLIGSLITAPMAFRGFKKIAPAGYSMMTRFGDSDFREEMIGAMEQQYGSELGGQSMRGMMESAFEYAVKLSP